MLSPFRVEATLMMRFHANTLRIFDMESTMKTVKYIAPVAPNLEI